MSIFILVIRDTGGVVMTFEKISFLLCLGIYITSCYFLQTAKINKSGLYLVSDD